MLRLIIAVLLFLLVCVGAIAIALFHFYGWKGMVAFPFLLLALIWVGKKLIGKLIQSFALGLFSMKSRVLRGAALTVHSVTPVSKPLEREFDEEEDEEEDEGEEADEESAEEEEETEAKPEADDESPDEEETPKHYYEVDLTITPHESCSNRVWEPGEFVLTSVPIKSLEQLEEKEIGNAHEVLVWNGSNYVPDDECKYPGAQRLKVTFEVQPGASKAWLQYYNESIGAFDLPRWEPVTPG
jgi:hypothetical protein